MVRLGKTYGNLMVDVRATNEKLRPAPTGSCARATGLDRGRPTRCSSGAAAS
jgi:N-acetylmuramic acid 6-phosphate (MurNAc-6-P) etherase